MSEKKQAGAAVNQSPPVPVGPAPATVAGFSLCERCGGILTGGAKFHEGCKGGDNSPAAKEEQRAAARQAVVDEAVAVEHPALVRERELAAQATEQTA